MQKRPANGGELVEKLAQIKTKAKENETALVNKVEQPKEGKSPLRPVHFFWLMLIMALFALYIRYEEVKPARKLSLQAQEQKIEKGILLFPNGFFWTFRNSAFIGRKVKKGKTFAPYWKAVDKAGSSRQGKFRKFKGAWVAECMGLRPRSQLSLSIIDGDEELFKREVTVPNEKPDLGLRVRRGLGWADISWTLPVPIPIEVFIGEEFGHMRLLGSFVDKCHYTGKEAQGKQPMRYRLALGERTLFNGSCFPGFRQRFRLPAEKLGTRNTPSSILFDNKGNLELLFGSHYIVSLKHTETTSGSMMVPQWYFNCKTYAPLERPEAASYKDSTLLPLSDDLLDVVFGQHKPSMVTLYRKQKGQKRQVNKLATLPGFVFDPMALALPNGRFVIAGSNEELLLQCYLGMSDGKITKLERLISCEYVSEICWEGERLYLCCWQGKRATVRCISTKGNELRALWSMPLSTLDFRKEGIKQRNVISMGPRPGKKAGVIVVSGPLIYCFKHKGGSEMEAISYRIQPATGKLSSPTVELDDDTVGFLYITPEPGSVLSMYEGRFMSASFKDKPQVRKSPQKWSFSGNVRKTLISRPQHLGNNKILSGAGLCVLLHSRRKPFELINRIVVPWGVRHAFIYDGVLYVLNDDGVIRGTDLEGSYE